MPYCKDCRHYEEGRQITNEYGPPKHYDEICNAPENHKDDHREEDADKISQPLIINRFNDCPWFDSKITCEDSSSSSSNDETPQDSSSSSTI